ATASRKPGRASPGAVLGGPPFTAAAAATTRLPVTWAVKTWPRVKKPVRSTIPATTLSSGGSRASRRTTAAASSAAFRTAAALSASADMFGRTRNPGLHRSVAEIIDRELRNDEAHAHRHDDDRRDHSVGDRPLQQGRRGWCAAGDLDKAAHHPEQIDPRNHRHDGGKADGRKRHVRAARNRREDQSDDEAGDQRA